MEIVYSKEETLKLIEEYYKKLEGREVKASIKSEKSSIGYYGDEGCLTTITITEKMDVCGMTKDVVTKIEQNELTSILKALFGLYDFNLQSLVLNDGLSSRWEGYGMMEHQVKSAYFKGITVSVDKNVKSLKKV